METITVTGGNGDAVIMCGSRDEQAISHLYRIMSCGAVVGSKVRVMPDYHEGKGSVIGFTQRLDRSDMRVCPNFVGVDIGCRVSSMKLPVESVDLGALDKWIRANIPLGAGSYLQGGVSTKYLTHHVPVDLVKKIEAAGRLAEEDGKDGFTMKVPALGQLCSLGGGNHFIALNRDPDGKIWLSVHSGSRNLGLVVCNVYQRLAVEECSDRCEPDMRYLGTGSSSHLGHYLEAVDGCQAFSEANHMIIMNEVMQEILRLAGVKGDPLDFVTTLHNYIDLDTMTIRKGSVSAKAGERFLLPLNMRDGIAICVGKGNDDWNQSAPHGCGRLMSRAEAKRTLDLEQAKREMAEAGVFTTSLDYALDEAAGAYKDKGMVLEAIGPTADIVSVMPEIYNIKGR